jgi:hypothetical protein
LNLVGSSRTAITIIDHLSAIWSRIGRLGQSERNVGRSSTLVPGSVAAISVSSTIPEIPEVRY